MGHEEVKSIEIPPDSPLPSALSGEDKKKMLMKFESQYLDAKSKAKGEESLFFYPNDNIAVVEVREDNPKAVVSTPHDKDDQQLSLFVKESLQYFSQPKVRVVRKYKDYVKETIDDDKFSRKKYEKDVAQKKKKKDAGNENNFTDMMKETSEKVGFDMSLVQEGSNDTKKIIKKEASGRLMKTYDMATTLSEYNWEGGAEVTICKRTKPKTTMELKDTPILIDVKKFEPKLCEKFGELEPFFIEMAVFDLAEKKKISETFSCHVNSKDTMSLISSVKSTDINTQLTSAVFHISQRSKDNVLFIQVSKVLQGDEDAVFDPYLRADKVKDSDFAKLKKNVPEFCPRLADYKQAVCWSAIPLFSEDDDSIIVPNKVTQFYRNKGVISDTNFIQLFGNDTGTQMRRLKAFPASLTLNVTQLVDYRPIYKPDGLVYVNNQEDDTKPGVHAVEMFEFPPKPTLGFFEHYSNYLFVYPEDVNLSTRQFSGKSARNIGIKIQLKEDDTDLYGPGLKCIYGKAAEASLVESGYSKVSYHNRNPEFNDEFKIKLPTHLTPKHHLLFTFYHVGCQKPKSGNGNILLGYSVVPLLQEGRLVNGGGKFSIISDFATEKGLDYMQPTTKKTYIDGGKQLFSLRFKSESTVYTFDEPLAVFFQSLNLLTPPSDKKVNLSDQNLDTLIERSVNGLSKTSTSILIQSLPQVFNQLLKIICSPSFPRAQKAALKVLLVLCENNAGARNDLLRKYIEEKYFNFPNTQAKLFKELPRLWLQIVEEWRQKRHESTMKIAEPLEARLPLEFSWFVFEIISKSMVLHANDNKALNSDTRNDAAVFGPELIEILERLVRTTAKEIIYRSGVGLNIAKALNANLALFLRDLLDILDRGFVLSLMSSFLRIVSHTPDTKHIEVLQELKIIFLQVIVDYEHYVPMCLPSLERSIVDQELFYSQYLSGLLIEHCVKDIINKERVVRTRSLNLIRSVLTKHEYDKRYQSKECKEKVATLYFPLLIQFLESFEQFSEAASEKTEPLKLMIQKCQSEYQDKNASYITASQSEIVSDKTQEEQLQKLKDEAEAASKKLEDAKQQLVDEKQRIVLEKQNVLISVIYILKNMNRNMLREWWIREMNGKLDLLLNMCHMCVDVFEYRGREAIEKSVSKGIESSTKSLSDAKSELENMYTSLKHRARRPEVGSVGRTKTRNFKVTGRNTFSKTQGKNMTEAKSEEDIKAAVKWEGNLNTETSLSIIEFVSALLGDIEEFVNTDFVTSGQSSFKPFDTLFKLLLKFFNTRQSDSTVIATISLFKVIVRRFRSVIFTQATTYCEALITELLTQCHSAIDKIRMQATALLYSILKVNYETSGNFIRTKIQTTVALSNLATQLDPKGINILHGCFEVIAQYAAQDKIAESNVSTIEKAQSKRFSLKFSLGTDDSELMSERSFPDQVKELVERLGKTLMDTLEVSKLDNENADNEMKCELLYRIANGYRHAPELSVSWINNLAEQHKKKERFVEAAQGKIYIAALSFHYLKLKHEPWIAHADYQRLLNVSPSLKYEKFDELRALFLEQEKPEFSSKFFNKSGFYGLLEEAITLFNEDGYYEYSVELYKLFMGLYEHERDYKALQNVHSEMGRLYEYIFKSNVRLFGSYYRICFVGQKLPDDIREKAFIYKMPKITRLADLIEYLKSHFGPKYGENNIEIVGESFAFTKCLPDKIYLQITTIKPHVRDTEHRQGFFEQNTNISEFIWETPYTLTGKPQGELQEQYKRKTIIKVQEPFPAMMTRIPIIQKEEIVQTPIENAIEIIDVSIDKLIAATNKNPIDVNALHLVLSGTLIPQVHEGIPQIVKAFLGNESAFDQKYIAVLRSRLAKFLSVCMEGIRKSAVHSKDAQKPLHNQFEKGYIVLSDLIASHMKDYVDPNREIVKKQAKRVQFM